jgi:hypothetical protein
MPGALDPQYVVARSVLLDALQALGEQREAVIVVGAQAIYLHTGAIELAVPELTIDADLTIDPALLHEAPEIESAHAREVARKARGLEAALVDKDATVIAALDSADSRSFSVAVAGPAALLISQLHKIAERLGEREQRRLDDKDALDILRLLQAIETETLTASLAQLLQSAVAGEITREAVGVLENHFTDPRAAGSQMAARAVGGLMSGDEVARSCAILASELLRAVRQT